MFNIQEKATVVDESKCPTCNSDDSQHVLINYEPMWHEGDIVCKLCGSKVRKFDAG